VNGAVLAREDRDLIKTTQVAMHVRCTLMPLFLKHREHYEPLTHTFLHQVDAIEQHSCNTF